MKSGFVQFLRKLRFVQCNKESLIAANPQARKVSKPQISLNRKALWVTKYQSIYIIHESRLAVNSLVYNILFLCIAFNIYFPWLELDPIYIYMFTMM